MFKLMDNWPYESIRCQNNLFTFNYCKLQNKSVISVLVCFVIFFNDLLVLHSAYESQRPPKLVIGIKN